MKGAHQTALNKAKADLLNAAQQFVECQAFAYKELLLISIKHLDRITQRAVSVADQRCPYCQNSTKRSEQHPHCPAWTCDCFEY